MPTSVGSQPCQQDHALGLRERERGTVRVRAGSTHGTVPAHAVCSDPEATQRRHDLSVALAKQTEQDMLGPDMVITEASSFIPRELQCSTGII